MFGGIDMASNLIQTNQIANIQTSKCPFKHKWFYKNNELCGFYD